MTGVQTCALPIYTQRPAIKTTKRQFDVDWAEVYGDNTVMKRSAIINRLSELHAMTYGSAANYITKLLVKVHGKDGYYTRTQTTLQGEADNINKDDHSETDNKSVEPESAE